MSSMYSLSVSGQPAIEISQDELRSLLSEIEAELHNSKVYRRALATVQKLLGDSSDQAKLLFKAVGREAIGVAFRQLSLHNQTIADTTPEVEEKVELPVEPAKDLSECLTIVNSSPSTNIVKEETASSPTLVNHTASLNSKKTAPFQWFKSGKPSKAQIAKQTRVEQRLEKFREIGQQLKQGRESRGLCLSDLHMYTHIPVRQMEAVERGDMESLPADVYVRGFIRVMGNALGFNGTALAATLPTSETQESLVPSLFQSDSKTPKIGLDISPMHLYVGYTALVAGAVGGLSLVSHQQSNAQKAINPEVAPASDVSESFKYKENTAKPGIKSSNAGISIGSDIAPPEAV
ncbi:helix-turn-helix domain-containing protein [Rivularia sp. UHCC 0363]|nr:helix-turn-helix domain-containing protein [Rivularia sp. UHCC 0363]MEA5596190.1 helix-turn-helix domain-containing protein [Rivularia sp. UHCC 0363]